ncbi:MAG: glycosyltransferase [Candidatus Margulisiibacteriota bacterium]|jgi:glycosyltransferase involved in cell wall biosynthesis
MPNVAWFVPQYLNISETFIYEPLQKMQRFTPLILTGKKKNLEQFPYNKVYSSSEDLPKSKVRKNDLLAMVGKEQYFAEIIQKQKIQLLHAHFGVTGNFAVQFKERFGLPLVVSFYGADLYQYGRNLINKLMYKQLFKKADLFLTCSDLMRQDLIRAGCPADKVRRHYLGIDLNKISSPKRDKPKARLQLLLCGRFVEKKGFEYALRALEGIPKDKYFLNIIGDGSLKIKYLQIIGKLGLAENISFLGNANYAQFIKDLKQSDILIVPSVKAKSGDSEGCMNMVILEGMAAGTVILSSDHSAFPEVVKDGQTGYLSKEKDAGSIHDRLIHAIEHQQEFSRIRENARNLVENDFNIEKQVGKLEDIYQELIAKK